MIDNLNLIDKEITKMFEDVNSHKMNIIFSIE